MNTINYNDIKKHFKLLGHEGSGLSEMTVIFPSGEIRTAYAGDINDFISFCKRFSGKGNVYAGINPRPYRFKDNNKRAKDDDIEIIQHILFDIEIAHKRGTDLPLGKIDQSRRFAKLLSDYFQQRGFNPPVVNMSGNGWHLIVTLLPTKVGKHTKAQVKMFFGEIKKYFQEITQHDKAVKLDSTYDLSRLAKVAGTLSMKGRDRRLWRLSRCDPRVDRQDWLVPDEALTSYILGLNIEDSKPGVRRNHRKRVEVGPGVMEKIRKDRGLRWLWTTNPVKIDGSEDRSVGDFIFVLRCLEVGLEDDDTLFELLLRRPVGKGQERTNDTYIERTVQRARAARMRCG